MSINTYLNNFNNFNTNKLSESQKEQVLKFILEKLENYSFKNDLLNSAPSKIISLLNEQNHDFDNHELIKITEEFQEKLNSFKSEFNEYVNSFDEKNTYLITNEKKDYDQVKDFVGQCRSFIDKNLESNAKAIIQDVQQTQKKEYELPQYAKEKMKWAEIIEEAEEQSAHEEVQKLPIGERREVQKKEWLKGDGPLTGLCLGLAMDYLLSAELGENKRSAPTDEARYWSRAQIPAVDHAAKIFQCSFDDLQEGRHLDLIYERMMQTAKEKANLASTVVAAHTPLEQLGGLLNNQQGHLLAILEKPGNASCKNHTVYINPTTRIIADYSVVIKVPDDADFGAFVDYYMEHKYQISKAPRRVTLISVQKDPASASVRKPSFLDRAAQNIELLGMQLTGALRHGAKSELHHGEIPSWI